MGALLKVGRLRLGDDLVFELAGELDASSVRTLAHELEEAEPPDGGRLVLDVSQLAFIDSTGLAVLLRCNRRLARAGRTGLVLRSPGHRVMMALKVTGLDRIFTVEALPD